MVAALAALIRVRKFYTFLSAQKKGLIKGPFIKNIKPGGHSPLLFKILFIHIHFAMIHVVHIHIPHVT